MNIDPIAAMTALDNLLKTMEKSPQALTALRIFTVPLIAFVAYAIVKGVVDIIRRWRLHSLIKQNIAVLGAVETLLQAINMRLGRL